MIKTISRRAAIGLVGVAAAAIVTAAPALASSATLDTGASLSVGGRLTSSNGTYSAVLQGDGNFVLYGAAGATWNTKTYGTGANRVAMQTDGNLVLYNAAGQGVWSTGTVGVAGAHVIMQSDGNLVMYDRTGRAAWSSSTGFIADRLNPGAVLAAGQQLVSKWGAYRAVMQTDGNFVVYSGGTAIWNTRTSGSGANRVAMQTDGNLVLYTADGRAVWNSGTAGQGASTLTMQADGNLVVAKSGGAGTWTSQGGLAANPAVDAFRAWALNPANWNGVTDGGKRGIDADGWYGAQCADLGIAWSAQAGHRVGFDGWDTSAATKAGWHVVSGSMGSALPGDVVTRVGGNRHVVVVVGSASGGVVPVVQQNPGSPAVASYSTGTSGVIWRLN